MSDSDAFDENETHSLLAFGEEQIEVPAVLPVLPVRGVVVFPGTRTSLTVGRRKSLAALEKSGDGGFLVIATQRDHRVDQPNHDDLYPVACIARIYAHFGIELRSETEARMRASVANHPWDEHGPHRYGLEAFGLDPTQVAETFQAYCEHFRVEPEPFD